MLVTRMTMAAAAVVALSAAAAAKPLTLPAETNLRAAPGTKSEVITLIPKGSAVEVGDCDAGWCKVKFGDKEGFAIARNVSEAPAPAPTAARPKTSASSQANLQKLRRGYEQYFDGQNDITGSVDDEPDQQYSQNTPPRYVPPKNARRQYDRRVYNTEDFEDDDDVVAYVPSRPPVYYSYGPYPRYYSPGPYYYRRW